MKEINKANQQLETKLRSAIVNKDYSTTLHCLAQINSWKQKETSAFLSSLGEKDRLFIYAFIFAFQARPSKKSEILRWEKANHLQHIPEDTKTAFALHFQSIKNIPLDPHLDKNSSLFYEYYLGACDAFEHYGRAYSVMANKGLGVTLAILRSVIETAIVSEVAYRILKKRPYSYSSILLPFLLVRIGIVAHLTYKDNYQAVRNFHYFLSLFPKKQKAIAPNENDELYTLLFAFALSLASSIFSAALTYNSLLSIGIALNLSIFSTLLTAQIAASITFISIFIASYPKFYDWKINVGNLFKFLLHRAIGSIFGIKPDKALESPLLNPIPPLVMGNLSLWNEFAKEVHSDHSPGIFKLFSKLVNISAEIPQISIPVLSSLIATLTIDRHLNGTLFHLPVSFNFFSDPYKQYDRARKMLSETCRASEALEPLHYSPGRLNMTQFDGGFFKLNTDQVDRSRTEEKNRNGGSSFSFRSGG